MRKSLNLLAAAALLAALGACNRQDRAAPDGEASRTASRPTTSASSTRRWATSATLSNDMRNDAATVPGAVPDQAVPPTRRDSERPFFFAPRSG